MVQDLTKISRLYLLSVCRQIRFILLQNRQGKTRLSRWYVSYNDDERKKIETETHRTIVSRDNKMTSFLEVSESCGWRPFPFLTRPDQLFNLFFLISSHRAHHVCLWGTEQYRNHKIVYRRYAGLFFTLCVDAEDNELSMLEFIHLFVEVLD